MLEKVMSLFPEESVGEVIFANGRNGADYDWKVNGHLSMFKSDNVTVCINSDGSVDRFYYNEDDFLATKKETLLDLFTPEMVAEWAEILIRIPLDNPSIEELKQALK